MFLAEKKGLRRSKYALARFRTEIVYLGAIQVIWNQVRLEMKGSSAVPIACLPLEHRVPSA